MSDIYDGAFRTIVNECKQFVLPFINEVFGEAYDGTELIEFHPNEHLFPHTAVLYLRDTKKTPDRMLVQIEVPGDSARYYVPIAKIVKYSIDEIFEKKLYILIPFYIFTYEADFDEYNTDKEKLAELHGQYQFDH